MDEKHHLFHKGQTVLDLGFAPGAWTQVAVAKTAPGGRVLGIDMIPASAPPGSSVMQANFLSQATQTSIKTFFADKGLGAIDETTTDVATDYMARGLNDSKEKDHGIDQYTVDIILSDMLAPWPQVDGFWKNHISNAYYRLENTTGISVKDHASSMDLCDAALLFAVDTLKPGGHFVCKFYRGPEDSMLEKRLKAVFKKVRFEKPEASRRESREAYFVGTQKMKGVTRAHVLAVK